MKLNKMLVAVVVWCVSASASAAILEIKFENTGQADDFVFTPLWVGLHDGSFDLFSTGSAASAGLALLAETGDASVLASEFAGAGRVQQAGIGNANGFGGAPVVEGGETALGEVTINNPSAYQFLSFASMVIPSNDAFIGNGDPTGIRIFNADGSFADPGIIEISGADIYDAGSEVNNQLGAAFSALGGDGTDENGLVALHAGLDAFVGTGTAAGQTIGRAPGANQVIARISFRLIPDTSVPEPGSMVLLSVGLIALGLRKRRTVNRTAS